MSGLKISENIARFAVQTNSREIPSGAKDIARLSLLDWFAVSIAGIQEPVSNIVRELIVAEGVTGSASVFGAEGKFAPRAAALSNGTSSHALDYDDTHFIHIGHPSVGVIPAATAIAQFTDCSRQDWLDASLIGMEVACRVGDWLGREHYQCGFHQTATAGSIGATSAAARLLGLSVEQTCHALGVAATRTSGLKCQFGTMGKPYHAGMAAANGVEAGQLALAGFISRPDALECEQGLGRTHHGEFKSDAFDSMGSEYVFESVQHKFHACCHGTHASLEAIKNIRDNYQLNASNVERLTISVHPRWLSVCDISVPKTGLEAKFSYRMTAALCLCGWNTASIDTFTDELCEDQSMQALCERVYVQADDKLTETAARVVIDTHDGTSTEDFHDLATPMTYQKRREKVQDKSVTLLGEDRSEHLWSLLSDEVSDMKAVAAVMVGE